MKEGRSRHRTLKGREPRPKLSSEGRNLQRDGERGSRNRKRSNCASGFDKGSAVIYLGYETVRGRMSRWVGDLIHLKGKNFRSKRTKEGAVAVTWVGKSRKEGKAKKVYQTSPNCSSGKIVR